MPNHVETWPVGQHRALFSSANGTLALANEAASAVWERFSHSVDVSAAARWAGRAWGLSESEALRIVDSLFETWRAAGLLHAESPPAPTAPAGSLGLSNGAKPQFYSTSFGCFRLVCEDPYAESVMAAVLSPLRKTNPISPDGTERQLRLELFGTADAYWVTRDGVALCEPGNISQARHEVLKQLVIDRDAPERTSAVLHAGAVSIGGRAVVFPGDCGRGKSTLTACLVHAGAAYIGDDLIPLERNGAWVTAFPVALSVKPGARELVHSLHAARRWSDMVSINDWQLEFVDLSDRCPAENRVPVGAIVFPHFEPGAEPASRRVEPESALQLLIASGSRAVGVNRTMEGLCRLADKTPAYSITYGDWREAEQLIAGLLGGSRR